MHLVTHNGFVICELTQSASWTHKNLHCPSFVWQWILNLKQTVHEESPCFLFCVFQQCPSTSPISHTEETMNKQLLTHWAQTNSNWISWDFWKAFDNICHQKLFEKLCCDRIGEELLPWTKKKKERKKKRLRLVKWRTGIDSQFSQCTEDTSGIWLDLSHSAHFWITQKKRWTRRWQCFLLIKI